MPHQNAPVWFITGCSTGFGRELAKVVLEKGWCAVVTARNPDTLQDFSTGYDGRALVLKLDVTNPAQVAEAVEKAESNFGRIDVLVNNAGFGYLAAVEEGEDAEVRAMFETNVFALAAMTRAVLPGMRRRGSGHIINISSVAGLVGFPGVGYYNATKFAVEGLSEALAKEVEPLGIKVLVVEPGPFRTDWAGRSLKQTGNPIDAYAETGGTRRAAIAGGSGHQAGDPVRAAQAMIQAVQSETPPLHLVLGRMALENARAKFDRMARDFDKWEQTTIGADFPDATKAE
jgi:NAD(P)-dependent dehydrogenase (short-subunit alcohol dehydrogenase family)